MSFSRSRFESGLVLITVFIILFAFGQTGCGGPGGGPERIIKKVVRAHGGSKGTEAIENFTGRGFLKELPVDKMVKNYPLAVFQRGNSYKQSMAMVDRGKAVEKWVWIGDENGIESWSSSGGWFNRPELEYRFLKYRFPLVITWMSERSGEAELLDDPKGFFVLGFTDGENQVKVNIDSKRWTIRGVSVSKQGGDLLYSEEYADYREVNDIPFPARATRSLDGNSYCEAFTPAIEYGVNLPDSVFTIAVEDTLLEEPAGKTGQDSVTVE